MIKFILLDQKLYFNKTCLYIFQLDHKEKIEKLLRTLEYTVK